MDGERRRLAEELLDLLRERLAERPISPRASSRRTSSAVARNADVAADQRLLEPLPRFIVGRIERAGDDLLRQRTTALGERVAQPREEARALVARRRTVSSSPSSSAHVLDIGGTLAARVGQPAAATGCWS